MAGPPEPEEERLWPRRLRWRLRGAWAWPAFALCTALDALVLSRLPFAGDGSDYVPMFLAAGFANLALVAAVAPAVGLAVRRRHPELPAFLARDRAATGLLLGLLAVLVAAGVAHRPAVREADEDFAAQARAARRHVLAHAPAEFRAGLAAADTVEQSDDFYRTCVPGPDAGEAYCVLVRTDRSPPSVTADPDQRPNTQFHRAP